jgi:hypothetical protein
MSAYDPTLIQHNLRRLGMAGLAAGGGEPLVVNTGSFAMKVASIPAGNASLASGNIKVNMPPLKTVFPDAAAASLINWIASPYNDSTQKPPDSPTISLSLLKNNGDEVSVTNLTSPIAVSLKLNIAADDWRLQPPPQYYARCDVGQLLIRDGEGYKSFKGGVIRSNGIWSVPCMGGVWYNISCADKSLGSFRELACPSPVIERRCLYWDTKNGSWSSDGCVASTGDFSTMTCHCTHLTDFSARVDAVVADNAAVFANAGSVYSLEGLLKYAQWYGIFGGIALVTLLLGILVTRIDHISTIKYVKALIENEQIGVILKASPNLPIYIYDNMSTMREIMRKQTRRQRAKTQVTQLVVREEPKITLLQRILQQHNRISFFFRYDPRLNRVFRLLALFVIQFHSLFVTGLLYGFTYGGDTPMAWYDIIILSLITTALNLPVVKILVSAINNIGVLEFKFLYPILYAEYKRRADFERLALIYFYNKHSAEDSGTNHDILNAYAADHEDVSDAMVNYLWVYLCCAKRKEDLEEEEDLTELTQRQLIKRMAMGIRESYPYFEAYLTDWGWLPSQTWQGWLFILGCCGWLGWCLNYLLLFAAAHSQGVGEKILTSYAVSEITTVFVSQPLIICATVAIYWLANRFKKQIPEWMRNMLMVNSVGRIPSLFYFSDPWSKGAKTAFTSEFAYNVFVKCPATATGTNERVYAPIRAVAGQIGEDEVSVVRTPESIEINGLYMKMLDAWKEIQETGR